MDLTILLIGIILSSTLINSVIFTVMATIYADKIGRRKILIIYAASMSISGIIYFVTITHIYLTIAALVGTIILLVLKQARFFLYSKLYYHKPSKNKKKEIHFLPCTTWLEHLQCLQEFYYPACPTS